MALEIGWLTCFPFLFFPAPTEDMVRAWLSARALGGRGGAVDECDEGSAQEAAGLAWSWAYTSRMILLVNRKADVGLGRGGRLQTGSGPGRCLENQTRLPCFGGRCSTRAVLGNDKREGWRMCTSVARGVPLSLAVRCRTRVAVAARRQLFQTDVSRQSTLATAMRGMQPADGTTATGDKCDGDGDGDVGRARHMNRQFCTGRDATPRHALGACGGDSGQPARRRRLADGAEGADGADGGGWRWVLMPSAERGVVACGGQGGRMAAWQDSRIEGGTAPEGERIKRRGGSKASKRDWTWYLGASQHCAGLGHGRHGGMEAWGHGGLEGRWKPVAVKAHIHIHGAHIQGTRSTPRQSRARACPRLLGRGLAASGLQQRATGERVWA
jgi:hypothetical protein